MFHVEHRITYLDFSWKDAEVDNKIEANQSKVQAYIDRLLWWNAKVNLVSRNVSRETLYEHIRHSMTLAEIIELKNAPLVIDAGCGGGLPGIPLALIMPGKQFILNDIVSKKIIAVKQMVYALGCRGHVECISGNVRDMGAEKHVLVSKHAFKVNELYELCKDHKWSSMVMLKGRDEVEEELDGIIEPLEIQIHDLEVGAGNPFYDGKAIAVIKRRI